MRPYPAPPSHTSADSGPILNLRFRRVWNPGRLPLQIKSLDNWLVQPVLRHRAMTTTNSHLLNYMSIGQVSWVQFQVGDSLFVFVYLCLQTLASCSYHVVFKMSCCKAIHNSIQHAHMALFHSVIVAFCCRHCPPWFLSALLSSQCPSVGGLFSFCLCPPGGRGEGVHPGAREDEFTTNCERLLFNNLCI